MKPTAEQLAGAVEVLAAIPYFPANKGARLAVMLQLERFVAGPAELEWLADEAVRSMREWKGMPELRGLYCQKFKPADGRPDDDCSLPRHTAADSEMRYALEEARQNYFPAPGDSPITEEERGQWAAFAEKLSLVSEAEKAKRPRVPTHFHTPKYLEEFR